MSSLARRIVLRSTGPHRNRKLLHVFRGQQRHLHEPAHEKPLFRWEVRRNSYADAGSV